MRAIKVASMIQELIIFNSPQQTKLQTNNSSQTHTQSKATLPNSTYKNMKRSHSCISISHCHNDEWEDDIINTKRESQAAAAGRAFLQRPKMPRIKSPDPIAVDCMLVLTRVDSVFDLAEATRSS